MSNMTLVAAFFPDLLCKGFGVPLFTDGEGNYYFHLTEKRPGTEIPDKIIGFDPSFQGQPISPPSEEYMLPEELQRPVAIGDEAIFVYSLSRSNIFVGTATELAVDAASTIQRVLEEEGERDTELDLVCFPD